jgi:chromosome segregation ATPase|eukprot:SAG25_NODE_200_length_12050_cov_3.693247_2_plen_199_part_00
MVEMKDRLRFSELQLERERARCQALQGNLKDVKTALSMCEAEMDRQAAERRVEAEQLLALRQQVKGLNDDKQAALDQAFRELAEWKQRAQQLEAQQRVFEAELDRARGSGGKLTALEKQHATADARVRELDRRLHAREKEVRHEAAHAPICLTVAVVSRYQLATSSQKLLKAGSLDCALKRDARRPTNAASPRTRSVA